MIDYTEIDKYFIGISMPVLANAGGVLLELGEDIQSLFYKIDEEHYADVNRNGAIVQVLSKDTIVTSRFVLQEDSLRPVSGKEDIILNSSPIKRLKFDSSKYKR